MAVDRARQGFGREPAAPRQFLGFGMVGGELFAVPPSPQVEPAVPHVGEEKARIPDESESEGCAHFPQIEVVLCGGQDALIGFGEDGLQTGWNGLLFDLRCQVVTGFLLHRFQCQAAGRLAARMATHAVGEGHRVAAVENVGAILVVFSVSPIAGATGFQAQHGVHGARLETMALVAKTGR